MSDDEDEGNEDEMRAEAEERLNVAVANVYKRDIQEVKALMNPPAGVKEVFVAVHVLRTGKEAEWGELKKTMANPDSYISDLTGLY